jgi:protein required for attachment to host cells
MFRTTHLASKEEFRLLKGKGMGTLLEDVAHRKADSFADGDYEFRSPKGQNRRGGVSFGVTSGQTKADIEGPRLARHAAEALATEWGRGVYDRIVISSGPKLLGALRKALPSALESHIAAELHKDLVKLSVHDLPRHLKDIKGI